MGKVVSLAAVREKKKAEEPEMDAITAEKLALCVSMLRHYAEHGWVEDVDERRQDVTDSE